MGRQELMRKQKLEREARKKGKKTRAEIAKYVKGKADKTGTTWTNRSGKIIQADEGRNKGRMFKEKAGQNIKNVRGRQKSRQEALKIGKNLTSGVSSWWEKQKKKNKIKYPTGSGGFRAL